MDFAWVVLGIAAWAIGVFLVLVIMQVAGDEEDKASRSERRMGDEPPAPLAKGGAQEPSADR